MARVRKVELSTIDGRLPGIQPFGPRDAPGYGPEDLFICALGFEPRCVTLPKLLAQSGYRSKHVVFFEYDTSIDGNEVNRLELIGYLKTISDNVHPISLRNPDYRNELRGILERISESALRQDLRITFDLSVAANRIVVTTMAILFGAEAHLNILYSEADIYHPTKSEYEDEASEWRSEPERGLECGVGDVRPSLDFPGQHFDPLPDAIILFPTFKAERSKAVIDFVDPSLIGVQGEQINWLVGVPPLQKNRWRIDALKEINSLTENDYQYETSTLNYKETLSTLEFIYAKLWDKYKLTLSPIGSKMQALGSSLFCCIHPDARIVFAIPQEYNAAQYSEGCRKTWKIEFGHLPKLRELLGSVGRLEIDE